MYQVNYLDRRGAGMMRTFSDVEKLQTFLSRLRRQATIRDESGRDVGYVWLNDDRRWVWYYENDCGLEPPGAPG